MSHNCGAYNPNIRFYSNLSNMGLSLLIRRTTAISFSGPTFKTSSKGMQTYTDTTYDGQYTVISPAQLHKNLCRRT